jgi:UDP-glucose 4-epimerase
MNVLVTGGAGYVGSIVTEELLKEAHQVIVLDNLQQGHKEAVLPEAEFVLADICDAKALDEVFRQFKIDAVMHMAAETVVDIARAHILALAKLAAEPETRNVEP